MTARELDAQRLQKEWNESARWKGTKRGYGADDSPGCAARWKSNTRSPNAGSEKPCGSLAGSLRQLARRADGQPSDAAGEGRTESDLPVGMAGRGRRESRR